MIDFNKRLKSMKDRRQGRRDTIDELNSRDSREREAYELLDESPGTRYAIGAMSPVDSKSTQISIREGERVANNLIKSLEKLNIKATHRMQGSVALDIHIKGHSDVDMLVISNDILVIEHPCLYPSRYNFSNTKAVDVLKDLRFFSESCLSLSFPKVSIDTSGDKSIALEGGSLARKVDIVPSCWFDSHEYQSAKDESVRGINIYHKANHELISNYPFKHIKAINTRDTAYEGNLKSVIRLLKNIVADMPDYKKKKAKKLSSYDLASIAYHMESDLKCHKYLRLGLVERTRSFLQKLIDNPYYRETLIVPDKTREIFDAPTKIEALEVLTIEVSDLVKAIYRELKPSIGLLGLESHMYTPDTLLNRRVEVF